MQHYIRVYKKKIGFTLGAKKYSFGNERTREEEDL